MAADAALTKRHVVGSARGAIEYVGAALAGAAAAGPGRRLALAGAAGWGLLPVGLLQPQPLPSPGAREKMSQKIESLAQFLTDFIVSKNLIEPDGRPLYEYKISDGRYKALKILLTDKWEENSISYAAFVLYAVEFLRAESSEGHLKWDNIFESIKKENLNTPLSREKIIKIGLCFLNFVKTKNS
jgi:hypothetical protein